MRPRPIRFKTETDVFALLARLTDKNIIHPGMSEGQLTYILSNQLISEYFFGDTYLRSDLIERGQQDPAFADNPAIKKLLSQTNDDVLPKMLAHIYKKCAIDFENPNCPITKLPIIFPTRSTDYQDLGELSAVFERVEKRNLFWHKQTIYSQGIHNRAVADLYWIKLQNELMELNRDDRKAKIKKLKRELKNILKNSDDKINKLSQKLNEDKSRYAILKENENCSNLTDKEFRDFVNTKVEYYKKKRTQAILRKSIYSGLAFVGMTLVGLVPFAAAIAIGTLIAPTIPILVGTAALFTLGLSFIGVATGFPKKLFGSMSEKVHSWFLNIGEKKIENATIKANRHINTQSLDYNIELQEAVLKAHQTAKQPYTNRLAQLKQLEQKYQWEDEFNEKNTSRLFRIQPRDFSPKREESMLSKVGFYSPPASRLAPPSSPPKLDEHSIECADHPLKMSI